MTTYLSSDHLATINRHGANSGLDPITGSGLQALYPHATLGDSASGTKRVTHSVHAECTLAMHALSTHKERSYIEIGVSGGSCWLCGQFLTRLRRGAVCFLVSNFNVKLQPGWTCPPDAAREDRVEVEGVVGAALLEIVERVLNRRRSDSFPHALSDDEVAASIQDCLVTDDLGWVNGAAVA